MTSSRLVLVLLGISIGLFASQPWRGTMQLLNCIGVVENSVARERSLFHTLAPAFFPLDNHFKIAFPATVTTVIIDVGARESDYLTALEATSDPTVGLLLFDPLPDSIVPLQGRVSSYGTANMGPAPRHELDKIRSRQTFAIRAALAQTEGVVDFHVGAGPACSSLLPASANNSFWCAKTIETIPVMVFRLQDVLDLIPPRIRSIHLKVDAEGADLQVIQGAGDSIQRCDTLIFECQNVTEHEHREQGCVYGAAERYLSPLGYNGRFLTQLGQGNAMFYRGVPSIPSFLKHEKIAFRQWYAWLSLAPF